VKERGAVAVVVGLPLLLSGQEGTAAQLARSYAAQLAERVAPVPVRLVDERLTTVDAHRRLRDSGVSGRDQRAVVDQAAAALILQAALDAESRSGVPAGETVSSGRRPRKKDRRR
jgi:putative Holliday junction resolvase